MASNKSTSLQPLTFGDLEQLDGQFCNEDIVVRLVHHWEARNPNKDNILMGIELLILDSKSNAAQAFIFANRIFRFKGNLKTNKVDKMKDFMLKPSKNYYSIFDSKFVMCFTDKTTMVPVLQENHSIDEQKFRLRTSEVFTTLCDSNTDLFDVIGEIRLVDGDNLQSTIVSETTSPPDPTRSNDRVLLHLQLKDGELMAIKLWGPIGGKFRIRWNQVGDKPKVILITTVNPRTFRTVLSLNSTSATRLFFDADVNETKELLQLTRKWNHLPNSHQL